MNTLGYIVKDVTRTNIDYKYNLPDIGLALEKLMGGAYESHYCSREFKTRWTCSKIDVLLQQIVPKIYLIVFFTEIRL